MKAQMNFKKMTFYQLYRLEFQRDALLKFGPKVICVDSTHGTNIYDFLLISVVVIDYHGEGLSVAWAVTNHEDAVTLKVFLFFSKAYPDVFISDDIDKSYSSFYDVYEKKLMNILVMPKTKQKFITSFMSYLMLKNFILFYSR